MIELFKRDYSPYKEHNVDLHLPLEVIIKCRELVESKFNQREIQKGETLNLYLLENGVVGIGHFNPQYIRLYALSKEGLDKLAEEIGLSKESS